MAEGVLPLFGFAQTHRFAPLKVLFGGVLTPLCIRGLGIPGARSIHPSRCTFLTFFSALRTVPLAEIAQLTREDGNKLHVAGEFGSYSLRFSNKRRRDQCIYLLKSRTSVQNAD